MKDLREWLDLCEKEGELKRIKAEVDWDLELSHVAKLNEEQQGPALLFEKIKGYNTPLLTRAFSESPGAHQKLATRTTTTIC